MVTTTANRANKNTVSKSVVIPKAICEALNVQDGDKIDWIVEPSGDPETGYLTARIVNTSNQETTVRKLLTGIRMLDKAFEDLLQSYNAEYEYSSTLKQAWENSKKYVAGLEKELSLYRHFMKETNKQC